jgi:hypothetical protein
MPGSPGMSTAIPRVIEDEIDLAWTELYQWIFQFIKDK